MAGDIYYPEVTALLSGADVSGSPVFTDGSIGPKTVTASGCTVNGSGASAAIVFNGSSSILSLADSVDWDFGTGDFAIDLRGVSFTSHASVMSLLGNYAGSSSGWVLQRRSDTDTLRFGNGDTSLIDVTWAPVNGTLYDITVSRIASALKLLVDGTQIGTTVTDNTDISGSTNPLLIGSLYLGGYLQKFDGSVRQVRITKGARNSDGYGLVAGTWPNFAGQRSGNVKDATGTNTARLIRAYNRVTGALAGETTSDASTGNYTLNLPTLDEHTLVFLDDDAGTAYNALVLDRLIPE